MANEIPEKVILKFAEIDKRIKDLTEKKNSLIEQCIEKLELKDGQVEGFIEQEGEEKPFLRVRIKDHMKAVEFGDRVHINAYFQRYSVDIGRLVRKPAKK